MTVGAVVARILTQYSDKGSKAAQKDIARLEKKISAFGKKATKSLALAGVATAAFAVKLGVDAVRGAAADEKQQAALATALRNTVGATDAAIAANSRYLDSLEVQVAIDNEKLIPALQKLVTATGDLTQAQGLLSLATDVSAASGKDLDSVSTALSRAVGGNFTALTRLGLPLDQAAIKAKDFAKIQKDLAQISRGQASAAANTFSGKLESLRLRFAQVSDKLGAALIPAIEILVKYIESDVVPMLDVWIGKNEDELNKALTGTVESIKEVVEAFKDIYNVIKGVNAILPFGLGGWIKLVVAINAFSAAAGVAMIAAKKFKDLKQLAGLTRGSTTAFAALKTELGFFRGATAKVIEFFQRVGVWANKSKGVLALTIRGFTGLKNVLLMTPWGRVASLIIALGYAINQLSKEFKSVDIAKNKFFDFISKAAPFLAAMGLTTFLTKDAVSSLNKTQIEGAKASAKALEAQLDRTRENHAEVVKQARTAAELAKDQKEQAAYEAKFAKEKAKSDAIERKNIELRNRLEKKFGLRLTDQDEYENIQLTAVEMLQKKQKDADAALLERLKARKEEILLFEALNQNAERYTDLLTVLSDKQISSEEIAVLAKKWGMTTDAVTSYIFTIFAIKDLTISSDEVKALASSWGITIKQAEQYLDFFNALNDGVLSETEITKLMNKWMLTRTEATKYADFVSKIGDGKLDDSEITKLKSTWGLTTQQVVDYIKKIGGKVDATGTILSAGDIAALGWTNALTALQKYLNAQAKGAGAAVPTTPGPDLVSLEENAARLREVTAKLLSMQEKIKNKVKIPDDEPSSNFTYGSGNPQFMEPITKAFGGGGGGGGGNFAFMANGGIVTNPTQAIIGEAGAEAVIPLNRIGSVLSSLTDLEGMGSGRSNNTNITVNVAGSVTSETDLVSAIRNGLLATQFNGNSLSIRAI
jgi:hypothetical protein